MIPPMDFLFLLAGGFLLFFGGEGLVKGSVSMARAFNLSTLFIGAVVVGFGTSMPEMSVSVKAAYDGSPGIVLGNVVGSNIANILLVLGFAAAVAPVVMKDKGVMRDAFAVVAAGLALCLIALYFGVFNFYAGVGMFTALIAYIVFSMIQDRKQNCADTLEQLEEELAEEGSLSLSMAIIYVVVGVLLLVGGAWLFVEGATGIARTFGISEAIIGLSIVAIGTSLPELATSIAASMQKQGDVIVGNVLGSSLFNILAILGLTAMLRSVEADPHIVEIDGWVMLATSILLIPFLWTAFSIIVLFLYKPKLMISRDI